MILNDFFDKIYCINLDERYDRWEKTLKEFDKIGLTNVERFSAIKHINGEIGCRNSHLEILKKAKKENLNKILIFEDDIEFINSDLTLLVNVIDKLKHIDWEIFYLGASLNTDSKLELISNEILKVFFAYTTHAYAVNSIIFDYLITEIPKNKIIDVFYRKTIQPRGKSYIVNPMFVIQRQDYSDIVKSNTNYNWMVQNFEITKKNNNIQV